MRECERVVALCNEELSGHRFVERIEYLVLLYIRCCRKQLRRRKRLAEDGRRAQHVVRSLTEAIESMADGSLDALRKLQIMEG